MSSWATHTHTHMHTHTCSGICCNSTTWDFWVLLYQNDLILSISSLSTKETWFLSGAVLLWFAFFLQILAEAFLLSKGNPATQLQKSSPYFLLLDFLVIKIFKCTATDHSYGHYLDSAIPILLYSFYHISNHPPSIHLVIFKCIFK